MLTFESAAECLFGVIADAAGDGSNTELGRGGYVHIDGLPELMRSGHPKTRPPAARSWAKASAYRPGQTTAPPAWTWQS